MDSQVRTNPERRVELLSKKELALHAKMKNESVSKIASTRTLAEIVTALDVNEELREVAKRDWRGMSESEWCLKDFSDLAKARRRFNDALKAKLKMISLAKALPAWYNVCG